MRKSAESTISLSFVTKSMPTSSLKGTNISPLPLSVKTQRTGLSPAPPPVKLLISQDSRHQTSLFPMSPSEINLKPSLILSAMNARMSWVSLQLRLPTAAREEWLAAVREYIENNLAFTKNSLPADCQNETHRAGRDLSSLDRLQRI